MELLVYVFRELCDNQKDTAVKEPSQLEADMFQRVFEYIRQNYTENISLERLAMLAFVSPKYFSRLFKNHTGITVTEYIQRFRVNRACELLIETACPVTEIAVQAEYSDLKYFNKVFRRLIGMTPAEYRRSKT